MLYFKTYESGKSLDWTVFIHGAGGSSAIWFKQIKEFKQHFNVLLIDLRGHGKSKDIKKLNQHYSFDEISLDILEVLNHLKIKKAHFIGISLGTIVIRNLAKLEPERVSSMVLGGAVIKLNVRVKTLITLGNLGKNMIPYMWLYAFFAWCIMPRKSHKVSRQMFVEQAKKLCQKEFIKWFSLTKYVSPLLAYFDKNNVTIPTLYLMGEEDSMFLLTVIEETRKDENAILSVIKNSGHVCNIDQPQLFNQEAIQFIKTVSSKDLTESVFGS